MVERKINDDDSPAFLLVLRYSRSGQSLTLLYCHFRAFTFLFIAPATTLLLCTINHGVHSSTAFYCHCHQLYVCHHLHKFSVNYQFKRFFVHWTKQKPRHSPHYKFIEFITRQDIVTFFTSASFVIFNTVKQTLFKSLHIYF